MSARELVILGTASQVPTRHRNHNGYLLRWDDHGLLFDPGEGTQRQMRGAGVAAGDVTRVLITHFHGDHCLGLPGVIQRMSLDRVPHPVPVHFPAGGAEYFHRLRYASSFYETATVLPEPVTDGWTTDLGAFTLTARRLVHSVEACGYRLVEPDSRRIVPELLATHGVAGPAVGVLQRTGRLDLGDGRVLTLGQVSAPRRGQRFAFVMDTGLCDAVFALADRADLLVIEATFLNGDAALAAEVGHLTAAQAARVARESGVRRLVLTHFSQRYGQEEYEPDGRFLAEARAEFDGDIVLARDLMRVDVPPRTRVEA
ncbi:ribonuclease Z [Catenuloplanes atrovinosus]|uniref:Ribonuclease Z n=1 Tax=Catenuloplanes atrovinosus TaxID=137266 RepID=A0AAE3YVA0_9ACTN|nr:ribonuclease Z [Catenuloplanes atrovinosus]MDR7279287.1 ribonuclease Z [Catenuloplanes atrovinosus]